MKRFVFVGISLFLLLIAALLTIFFIARSPLAEEWDEVEKIVMKAEGVQSVLDVDYYYGTEVVYTALVQTEGNGKEWIFVKDGEVIERIRTDETLSYEEATQLVINRFQLNKVKSVHAGMENNTPLYQMTFEMNDRLHFYYVDMRDGTFLKRYSIIKE